MTKQQKSFKDCRYPEDIKRLFNVALSNGLIYTSRDLEAIWGDFSDNVCAGWLLMKCYTDEELLLIIQNKYEWPE